MSILLLSLSTGFLSLISFSALANHPLKIITSANPGSSQVNSFIVVPLNKTIPAGIKSGSKPGFLKLQIPFVIDIPDTLIDEESVEWVITSKERNNGDVEVLSKFRLRKENQPGYVKWKSEALSKSVVDRSRLVFRPDPYQHNPALYKKGRGSNGKRRRYGGGTVDIDDGMYNPQISFQIDAVVKNSGTGETRNYSGMIAMDHKDMIRQEYINHYGINRYGRGENGSIPVPYRNEITDIPEKPAHLIGNAVSESNYGLMIDDGIVSLTGLIVALYEQAKEVYRKENKTFTDLNGQPLAIPESKLWLSGGWRNPERNEWFSNALNGIHQRGGAVDLVANEPHDDKRSAIVYWFLWRVLEQQNYIDGFWQLETEGRPMTTREFKDDIEPANGIPDAFDKADHIHINIKYEK